jgi:hypothetical protein
MDNPQFPLICDTLKTALDAAIVALGGNKKTGVLIWPALPADEAGRRIAHCMNPDKREKLSPDQFLLILREARKIGCHSAMSFILRECGYADPQPIEPEDERAALQRQFVEQSKAMQQLAARMNRAGMLP